MNMNWDSFWRRLARSERGSGGGDSLELIIVAPALLMLCLLIVAGGRMAVGSDKVDQAAAAAARAASMEASGPAAQAAAQQQAELSLAGAGVSCTHMSIIVDTSGFSAPLGDPASVVVTVNCTVALADLALPVLPGSKTVTGTAASPLDIHQERG